MQGELFSRATKLSGRDPRKCCDRLFFALMPALGMAARLVAFGHGVLSDARLAGSLRDWQLLEAARLHLSLCLVCERDELEQKYIFAAERAAQGILLPMIELTLGAMVSFPAVPTRENRRPFVLLCDSPVLRDLSIMLAAGMRRMGLRADTDFTPHLTLAYGPRAIPLLAIPPIHLLFTDFVLIKSEVRLHRYHVLDRWPLRGRL